MQRKYPEASWRTAGGMGHRYQQTRQIPPKKEVSSSERTKHEIDQYRQIICTFAAKKQFQPSECVEWCINNSTKDDIKDEKTAFNIGTALFSRLGKYPNLLEVIKILITHSFFSFLLYKKKSGDHAYSYFHTVAWIDSTSEEFYREIVKVLYHIGCDPFQKNNHKSGENAFQSIMNNTNITVSEQQFRYMAFATGINEKVISRVIHSAFNKVTQKSMKDFFTSAIEGKELIDRIRFVLCVNPEVSLNIIAKIFIAYTIKDACNTFDERITIYLDLLLCILSGADDSYRTTVLVDKSLDFFFKNYTSSLPTLNGCLYKLVQNGYKCALTENKLDNEVIFIPREIKLQALAMLIGALANNNCIMDEYEKFIIICLSLDTNKLLEGIVDPVSINMTPELYIKIVVRAMTQSNNKKTSKIEEALSQFPRSNSFIAYHCDTLHKNNLTADIQTIGNQQIDNKEKKSDIIVEEFSFFENITIKNCELVIDDSIEHVQMLLEKHISQQKEIMQQFFSCFVTNMSGLDHHQIKMAIDKIFNPKIKLCSKGDIPYLKKYFDERLDDIQKDAPKAGDIWQQILVYCK